RNSVVWRRPSSTGQVGGTYTGQTRAFPPQTQAEPGVSNRNAPRARSSGDHRRNRRDRKMQRALLQFFKPENYFEVRKALEQAGRTDLIGSGCDALIPVQ